MEEYKVIQAKNISVSIGGRKIIDQESIYCKQGKMTALVGPSGCGKTTLLHSLGLLLPINEGSILINGKDVSKYGEAERRKFWRDHAAFVLQDYGIMDEESIAYNVTMKSKLIGRGFVGNKERLEQALQQTGLKGRERELAGRLSGGEKQRLALARAIYKDAKFLFIDEPTASLDQANRQRVIDLFLKFAEGGSTVIVATHDAEMIHACDDKHEVGSSTLSNLGGSL